MSVPVRKLDLVGRPGEGVGQEYADVGEPDPYRAVGGCLGDVGELVGELQVLPGVVVGGGAEAEYGVLEPVHPLLRGVLSLVEALQGVQPVDQLGEPADQVDVGAVDVVDGHDAAQPDLVALHGDAEQQPVEPGPPGALLDAAHLPGRAVVGVEAPADAAAGDPPAQPVELVVVEAEPLPYGGPPGQVEHLGLAVTRAVPSSSRWASTSSRLLVCRRDRSAMRTLQPGGRVRARRPRSRGRTRRRSAGRTSRRRGT